MSNKTSFVDWLLTLQDRTDDIGWLSRLVASNIKSQQELRKEAGPDYIKSLPDSKIRKAIDLAYQVYQKQSKIAFEPKVGIFWIVQGEIVEYMTDASRVQPVAGFKDSPYDHMSMWDEVQKLWKATRGKDYIAVPRGRVIGIVPDKFRIFLPPKEVKNKILINKIMSVFSLPKGKIEVMGDAHYVTTNAFQIQENDIDEEVDQDLLPDNYDPFDDESGYQK